VLKSALSARTQVTQLPGGPFERVGHAGEGHVRRGAHVHILEQVLDHVLAQLLQPQQSTADVRRSQAAIKSFLLLERGGQVVQVANVNFRNALGSPAEIGE